MAKHVAISTLKNFFRPLRFSATEFKDAVFDETFFDFRISKNPPTSTTLLLLHGQGKQRAAVCLRGQGVPHVSSSFVTLLEALAGPFDPLIQDFALDKKRGGAIRCRWQLLAKARRDGRCLVASHSAL